MAAVRFGIKLQSVDNGNGEEDKDPQLSESTKVVTLSGAEIAVGRFVVDWWKRREESARGGLVFDLTDSPAGVYRFLEVPYGDVVVITSDGEITLKVLEISRDPAERLMGRIAAGTDQSIKGIEEFGRIAGAKKLVTESG
ncbi:MAG: hypothetical protein WD627_02910 [Actinomycetota bacterium]